MPALRSLLVRESLARCVPQAAALPSLLHNNPHRIHKMPVHGKHVDASGLLLPYSPRQTEEKHDSEHQQTYRDVRRVQTDKRIVCCAKKIGGDGQTVFVNKPVPFPHCAIHEKSAQHDGEKPQSLERAALASLEKF